MPETIFPPPAELSKRRNTMKLKYEMTFIDIDGSPMAVPVDGSEEFRGVLHMNNTTADILRCLENDVTEDEIVAALKEEYDATEEDIRRNAQKVITILREYDLICG